MIEEAAGFISLVRPRRVIPMHYWSPAYKDEWLGYLEEERTGGEWPAEVVRVDGPSYFFLADEDVRATGTIVISLEPAAFP